MWHFRGVKTYSDPSYIFSGGRDSPTPRIYAPGIIGLFRSLKRFYYIHYGIIVSFLIYSSSCDLFRMPSLPKQSVHHSLPSLRKCNNLKRLWSLYELPDSWPLNSPDLDQSNWLQNPGHNSIARLPDRSAWCDWFDAASDWCVGWSGTEHYCQCHWPAMQASWYLYSSHRRTCILNIRCD